MILRWYRRVFMPQYLGRINREIGIAQRFSADQDDVSLLGHENVLGLEGFGNQPDGSSWHTGAATDCFSKRHLVSRARRNFRRNIRTAGHINEVDTVVT